MNGLELQTQVQEHLEPLTVVILVGELVSGVGIVLGVDTTLLVATRLDVLVVENVVQVQVDVERCTAVDVNHVTDAGIDDQCLVQFLLLGDVLSE